ncbi:phage gp6-like head-tail connector protein [Streptomyces yunnanensis]|uniref:Phage gp6-like head-tail connector protein n=1 Tax=Streptomyces yunnanensis TaxID=156453 RepID=A0ABY8A1I8_9ACTN|nr:MULTISPECIES: phage gp6-like head-tail connector protein [Streptomyces]WEB38758.1 phage gp6-like head-tail connector protein [Streptomyces yunnanensis]
MTALITLDDVAARLGRPISEDEKAKIQALIEDVSALITAETGKDFQSHTDEVIGITSCRGPRLRLPWKLFPITDIFDVKFSTDPAPLRDWFYEDGFLVRRRGWWPTQAETTFPVVFVRLTYGYAEVPEDIRAVCAQEVIRWLAQSPGVSMERVGELQVQYSSGTQTLSSASRQALKKYRLRVVSTSLRR